MPRIELAGIDRLDEIADLWLALHRHERQVSTLQPLVEDDLSWQRRRALYRETLTKGAGFLVLASRDSRPVGYAFVLIEPGPDDTWPIGERYAELYSLSVAPDLRGMGLGTQVLDFVERELASRGIHDLRISVAAGNDAALRFYERRGLRAGEIVLYRFGEQALSRDKSKEPQHADPHLDGR